MSEPDFDSFNDPALRSAVRRAWAGERAPAELRDRIVALCPNLTRSAGRAPQPPMSMRIRSALYGLAAAAVFLLAAGVVFYAWDSGNPHRGHAMAALPPHLAQLLVDQHDADANAANPHTAGIPQGDFSQMAQAMRSKVGIPVLAASLPGAWNFRGASVAQVGNSTAGELLFERITTRRQYLSLFSLPLSFAGIEQSCECDYSQVQSHHPMAGFATSSGFYCVVASSTDDSVTLTEVRAIRDELRPKMDQPPPSSPPVAVIGR